MFREIFSRNGMPETLVTDNGTQFTSENFQRYCINNGILHLRTPPYHPQSNGLAERFVDTFKRILRKITAGGEALREAIDTFLLCYRSTSCRSAPRGKTPAELLLGRRLRTSLDLLKAPTPFYKPEDSKQEDQFNRKHGTKARNYNVKDLVWAKVHHSNSWTWEPGQVLERVGRVVYNIWLSEKQNLIRAHCNQLRSRSESSEIEPTEQQQPAQIPLNLLLDSWGLLPAVAEPTVPEPDPELQPSYSGNLLFRNLELQEGLRRPPPHPSRATPQQELILPRHSSRIRRAPVRYDPYHLY